MKASSPGANDNFGRSLALSDDGATLVIGAAAEDRAATGIDGDQADNAASKSGAAYVFTRSAASWAQQPYLKGFQYRCQ